MSYLMACDYMHTICLGITKKITTLWFQEKTQPYYIGNQVSVVDSLLKKLKTPNFISRKPRKIKDNLHRWKGFFFFFFYFFLFVCLFVCLFLYNCIINLAVEFRSWLLYYSGILLKGILPEKYHHHWLLFIGSMMILLSNSISPEDLLIADRNLHIFYQLFEEYYGLLLFFDFFQIQKI